MKKANSYLSFFIALALVGIALFMLRKEISRIIAEIRNDLWREDQRLKQQGQSIYYRDRNKAIDAALSNLSK